MSDWLILSLLAVAFYLYECCTWTPASAFACVRKPLRRCWRAAAGTDLVGNESGGFAFADPLTLSGTVIHCANWPIAISADGFCLDASDTSTFWTFESVAAISSYERTVLVNGAAAFEAVSAPLARHLAGHLEELRSMPLARRNAAIRAALHQSFDRDELTARWSRFQNTSGALALLAACPLVWLSLVTPAAFVVVGPLMAWPYLLGGLFLTSLAAATEFVRVHRRELPEASDRWLHAVSMTLFPIAAIRAADRISKDCLSRFNPCVVIAAFCSGTESDPILRRLAFDLGRALPWEDNGAVTRCRQWYRAELLRQVKRTMNVFKRDPFVEPVRIDPAMIAYCPRCHAQFGDGAACSDCDDVALTRFDEALEDWREGTRRVQTRKRA